MKDVQPYKLNLPLDVNEWLDAQAKQNLRSKANEIILALREKMAATSATAQK